MKFSILASSLMLFSLTLAVPSNEKPQPVENHSHLPEVVETVNSNSINSTKYAKLTNIWAGAVIDGDGYSHATGKFKVPTPKIPLHGDNETQYCAAAWVGIDGGCDVILQAGVDFCVQNEIHTFLAWYEWYPAGSRSFDLDVKADDEIQILINTNSKASGSVTVNNLTTKKSVSHQFSNQKALCKTSVEWIVEDFVFYNKPVPFANFETVHFTDTYAIRNGKQVDARGATILDIKQNNKRLTISEHMKSTVTIKHI